MKNKILIFSKYFTPSVKAGGPVQSIKNLVDNLSDDFDFYIVTSDRDLGDSESFPDIETEKWIVTNNANIYYSKTKNLNSKIIRGIIEEIKPNFLYLNSFFSYKFSIQLIMMKRFGIIKDIPIVIAPRGELSKGALSLKSFKKSMYIFFAHFLNLYNSVTWQATTLNEKNDILRYFNQADTIKVANNLTENYCRLTYKKNLIKNSGELKLVYLSRIHPTKNLKKCLKLLKDVNGKISFNIYGPIEDQEYWDQCLDIINQLNDNVLVTVHGPINHGEIMNRMNKNHVFILPTLGENYGHAIAEALIGGCPVIISDQTPWRNLEDKKVGWDIELKDDKQFTSMIQYCIDLNQEEYDKLSKNAFDYAKKKSNSKESIDNNYNLFTKDKLV